MRDERILIIEDELIVSSYIEDALYKFGFLNVQSADTVEAARDLLDHNNFDLVIMDIHLGTGIDGIDLVREVSTHKNVPVIYLSGHCDNDTLNRAKSTMPMGFINKPISETNLRIQVELGLYKEKQRKNFSL